MKSERRHELQHNELAEWLFKAGERLRPYQNLILAGVAVAVVAVAAYSWWARTSATRASRAWTELARGLNNRSPEMLTAVVEGYPNTVVSQTAAAILGDFRLAEGCDQRFVSMAIAQQDLSSAIASYSLVLDQSSSSSLRERATYGMARARETQGELEPAKDYYKKVVETWPNGTFADAARRRLEAFEQLDTKLMFGDLRKYDPKPAFTEEPGGLGPQPNLGAMPEEPAVPPTAPSKTDVEKKSDVKDKTEKKSDATKSDGAKKEAEPKKK